MNLSEIEAFLAIVDSQSITKAAETLYLSQSTISHRLKSLEKELETTLIIRGNGQRTIYLTPKGEEFVQIARKWAALWRDTQQFKTDQAFSSITVGSADSLNLYLFSNLYNRILNDQAPINLQIRTQQCSYNYMLLENREIDIGFTVTQFRYKNIITTPLLSEPMFLVCRLNSYKPGPIHPSELDPRKELYVTWGSEYQRWHDYWWNPAINPYISINAPSFLFNFMRNSDCWSIMPISIAKVFENMGGFEIHTISEPPPNRICYKLTHRDGNPENPNGMEIFDGYLKNFLSSEEWIENCNYSIASSSK
ncbi:LysR family transcriptional regulator [Neobacillus niacini]|uniref:LysR family transcriptional regulator n=1 Tax=Neobacillus niacini TaxID=86668 RepID=UPI002FFFEB61